MKTLRHKILLLTLPLFALLAITFALFSYYSEPRHHGRPLSAWLQDYTRHFARQAEAEKAIRAIGTNGIPTLVKMLLPVERTFSVARLFRSAGIPIELLEDDHNRIPNHLLAMNGFRLLGPAASNATPLLLPHLQDSDTAYFVADAFQTIGQPALAPVQQLLNSTNADTRRHAVHIILGITRRDPATVSNLLSRPDHIIRGETYLWLRSHNIQPEYVLSTLLDGLNDPHTYVSQRAVLGIRSLGLHHATNALPRLYELQSTTNTLLAREITTAIKNIEKRVRIENSASLTTRK